jgi:pyruvate,orthophosphate dikinase
MTFGYSRDDAEGGFLLKYVEDKILPYNPFQSLDPVIVKEMDMAVKLGRKTRPDLKVGICGEHGGDPMSIGFCHQIGLNYVSCSPFRVPVARLAAAQAALQGAAERASRLSLRATPNARRNPAGVPIPASRCAVIHSTQLEPGVAIAATEKPTMQPISLGRE